jgi:OmpA-OmpF porin, OOP family
MRLSVQAFLFSLLLAFPLQAMAQGADVPGSADHPEIGRYEGAVITFYEQKGYEELALPSGPIERGQRDQPGEWQVRLEGRLTSIRYEGPGDRSALEILRNYQRALEGRGFDIVFTCRGRDECSPGASVSDFWNVARGGIGLPTTWDGTTYLLARRDDPEASIWVGIAAVETPARTGQPLTAHLAVTVVETVPMETDRIGVIAASELEQALEQDGRIAIYGIYFDFDSADILPDSADQISELARLLADSPSLKVLVVGHTDGRGGFDYNLLLSQRRAQAVVDTLATGHGITRDRMQPAGAGMVSPVATNRTDEGRARNRRVEIVELVGG